MRLCFCNDLFLHTQKQEWNPGNVKLIYNVASCSFQEMVGKGLMEEDDYNEGDVFRGDCRGEASFVFLPQ